MGGRENQIALKSKVNDPEPSWVRVVSCETRRFCSVFGFLLLETETSSRDFHPSLFFSIRTYNGVCVFGPPITIL